MDIKDRIQREVVITLQSTSAHTSGTTLPMPIDICVYCCTYIHNVHTLIPDTHIGEPERQDQNIFSQPRGVCIRKPVGPVAYQVILDPALGQLRDFESPRVHTRKYSWGLFLAHKLTCGKRESVS